MKAVVLGAGDLILRLLDQLTGRWEVVLLENDPQRLERAAQAGPLEAMLTSGTLRQSLERAGLAQAAVLLAASGDDETNLEACRIAGELGVRSVAVAVDPESLEDYRRIGTRALSADRLVARRLVSTLEPQRLLSAGLAGELLEVVDLRVASRSPVCDRPLRSIDLKGWLVVGVLRDERLEVPHGDTVLQSGDVVTLVGEDATRQQVLAAFTSGIPRFPTEFGPRVAVALDTQADLAGPVAEAAHLVTHSAAEGLAILHRRTAERGPLATLVQQARAATSDLPVETIPVDGDPRQALLQGLPAAEAGILVSPAPAGTAHRRRREVQHLMATVSRLRLPILVSRRSLPYRTVLVPARDTSAGRVAAEAAIDIAARSPSHLVGLAVIPPAFIAADNAQDQAIRAAGRLQIEAAAHGVEVRREIRQGNEVRLFRDACDEQTLVVLGARWRPRLFGPGIAAHLVRRLPSSVLIVPARR
jgi:Trk K+ transport system NAD-binding subunit/nucleotide-binding universal stress UspA family protein